MMCVRASDQAMLCSSRQCSSQYGTITSATRFCSASSGALSRSLTTGSARRHSSVCCSRSAVATVSCDSHTVPQRDTEAGVANFRFSTSNRMRTLPGSDSRSPVGSVSSRLSSSTLFRFSAHSGSTSPSNTIQWRRADSPRTSL